MKLPRLFATLAVVAGAQVLALACATLGPAERLEITHTATTLEGCQEQGLACKAEGGAGCLRCVHARCGAPMSALALVAAFLLEHADLIGVLKDAIDGGASKADLEKAIKASMIAASDAEMIREGVT